MKDRFIVDSSIWIELERKNQKIIQIIQPLIENNEVCIVDLIAAEVLRGVKTEADFKILKDAFSAFDTFSTSWDKVAELAFAVGRKGHRPPLSDLYIAQCAIDNELNLITQDQDFLRIQSVKNFKLQMISKE